MMLQQLQRPLIRGQPTAPTQQQYSNSTTTVQHLYKCLLINVYV